MNGRPNIVLVHGAWADGSCWTGVIERLQEAGFIVRAPQFPLTSLADDVARLRQVLAFQDGPTIVVGSLLWGPDHDRARHRHPECGRPRLHRGVRSRRGRVTRRPALAGTSDPSAGPPFTDQRGFVWLSEEDFVGHFAGDVERRRARAMWAVQQPLAGSAFAEVMAVPAWKSLPSWYLVAKDDEAIPPNVERQFAARMGATTVEVSASHVAMVSQPDEVAPLVERAAESVGAAALG